MKRTAYVAPSFSRKELSSAFHCLPSPSMKQERLKAKSLLLNIRMLLHFSDHQVERIKDKYTVRAKKCKKQFEY